MSLHLSDSTPTEFLHLSHVHRGGGKFERPDNTLATFLWCWRNGSALECDCRRTKDGVGIMLHDSTLARTARGISAEWAAKDVSTELTWDEIKDIDVGSYLSPEFKDHRIPRIEAVLAQMLGHPDWLLFVDEKGFGPVQIAQAAREAGVLDQVYYTGCSYGNAVKWAESVPGGKNMIWIGAFPRNRSAEERVRVQAHFAATMDEMRSARFEHVDVVSLHTYFDPDDPTDPFVLGTDNLRSIIAELHANGIVVCSIPFAGGEDEATYHRLWELGCDGFSSDYPSVMFKVIHDLKSRP